MLCQQFNNSFIHLLHPTLNSFSLVHMARDALLISWRNKREELNRAKAAGKKPKFPTRAYNRCELCGRKGGFMRYFGICRICFRELAIAGEVPGIKKSSW